MIVAVRRSNPNRTDYVSLTNYSDCGNDRDKARKIAFRFVYKRREQDFNELVHNTSILEVVELNSQVQDFALSL